MRSVLMVATAVAALMAGPAFAADIPVKAPQAAPVALWSGCYIGGNGGYGWGDTRLFTGVPSTLGGGTAVPPGTLFDDHHIKGPFAGGQVGCDAQISSWLVVGMEIRGDWADIKGHASHFALGGGAVTADFSTKVDSILMLTQRTGLLLAPNFMLYYRTGVAWSHQRVDESALPILKFSGVIASNDYTRAYLAVGAGGEYRLTNNWSVFAEADYLARRRETVNLFTTPLFPGVPAGTAIATAIDQRIFLATVGINYRFSY